MGHHLKGHHGKKTNASGGFLTKLLAGSALVGVGKKLYDNREKIKELLSDDKEKSNDTENK
ncbi:hypothetical protein CYQ36_08320 [Enterococcus faecalis]|nr:hypothetical protein CYQ36_08320 [Enterococcus faecalis]RXV22175.1 hypothetical protein CYQ38_05335 [Enterococcus faecalis]